MAKAPAKKRGVLIAIKHTDMLKAHMVTIWKLAKDPTTPQNVCPIPLLNVGVKIYGNLLASGLLKIPPILIKSDPKGFTAGRQ